MPKMDMSYAEAGAYAWLFCNSYMAHPFDAERRKEHHYWVLSKMQDEVDAHEVDRVVSKEQFQALISAGKRGVGNDLAESVVGGMMAGDTLLYALQLQMRGVQDGGLDKAFHLTSTFYLQAKNHIGKPFKAGRDTVQNNWKKFKPVAHLWAAYSIAYRAAPDGSTTNQISEHLAGQQDLMTRAANLILTLGCAVEKPRAKTPLLTLQECWEMEGVPDAQIGIPAFTDLELEALGKFESRFR